MIESGICHNCFAVNNVLRCQSYKNSLSANSFRSHEAQKKPNVQHNRENKVHWYTNEYIFQRVSLSLKLSDFHATYKLYSP